MAFLQESKFAGDFDLAQPLMCCRTSFQLGLPAQASCSHSTRPFPCGSPPFLFRTQIVNKVGIQLASSLRSRASPERLQPRRSRSALESPDRRGHANAVPFFLRGILRRRPTSLAGRSSYRSWSRSLLPAENQAGASSLFRQVCRSHLPGEKCRFERIFAAGVTPKNDRPSTSQRSWRGVFGVDAIGSRSRRSWAWATRGGRRRKAIQKD